MATALKRELITKGLVPGELKSPIESSGRLANLKKGDVLKTLTNKDLQALLGKGKYPCSLDLSSNFFELDNDQFLTACRDVLKDLCLSNNPLREISSADHLTKLKVLVANGCRLQNVSLNKLESLELLSLADNQLTAVPKMSNLQKLVNLDLSGNPLSVGFEELENLKSLQVVDLARTGLDITIQQLFQFVVTPLKKLPKLVFVSFAENPVEVAIIKFRLFIISELPKLKYMDWQAVGKDERSECVKQERLWRDDKVVPAAPLKMPILVSRATRMGAGRAGAGASAVEQQQVLGPDDKALVNFLLGDDAGGSSGAGGQAVKSKDSMLDDFLHETTADPLNDIMSYLSPEKATSPQSAGAGGGGAGGGDYEDELMRIIYGDRPPAKQQDLAPPDDDIFTTITADLDAALGFGPGDSVPKQPLQTPKKAVPPTPSTTSVADTDLDDLLNSIIAVEERKGAPAAASAAAAAKPSGIDALLAQEEGAKQRRLEEERARVEQERARLEQERAELEQEKKRELEREKARLRAEMEAQKQREIDAARAADLEKQRSNKSGKNTQALENEAMAMLDMMEEVANGGGVAPAPVPAVAAVKASPALSKEEQDADDLLASIDALVGGPSPAAATAAKAPVVPKAATPPPVEKKVFGPRSPAVGAKLPSSGAALPIARRRRDDDDDLESLLSEAKTPEVKKVVVGATPTWLSYWSQLNFGDRLGIGTLGVTSVGWCRSSEVTIKKLKLQRFTDEFLKRFQEEVPLLVSLQHPNIVRFVGVCLDDSLCLLQQYIRGCSLFGYLRNEGNLVDLPFITSVSRGVAAGIAYLHSKKVYHRNLHSKNVILDGEMVPKLRDYGMQFIKNETYQLAMGPVQYEAPELLSRSPHTEAVDAYAFGVLLWELFCRELPYKHLQPTAIKEQVLADELRPDITPDIPVVFRRLMGACWNTDPSRRPTFLVVGKILSKPASELGAYGSEGGPTTFTAPKLQGPAAGRAAAPAVDLVATLDAPAAADSTTALMDKIASLLNSDDRLTQQRGLRVTYNLCEKAEYRERLHLMKVLVSALIAKSKSGVEKVTRDLALQALGKICVAAENAEEFLQCLGWPVLLDALDSMDVTLELSASMLMVVLLKNAQNKDAFVSVKAVPVLVKLLFSETENVKTNAVWAASLALENEQTQKQFVAEGGVPVLLRLAQSQNPGVVLRVLLSVGLLLTNPTVFHELKDSGVIQRFVRLLSSPSPLLQQHGAEVMVRFCQIADLREVLYRNNAIPALLELLAATSDTKLKKLVVSALSCYLDEDSQMAYIEQTQALRPIVRLMVSNDADLRMEALRMISKAAGIPELRSQLMTMGAISPLAQMLNVKDKQLRMAVLYSLCVLSEDEAVAVAVALADGCAQLVRLCSSNMDDVDVLELAAETFANLSRSQQGVSQMRECSAFPLLVKLIDHPNAKVVEGAANAFVQASSLPEGRLTIVALDGVEKLLSLCNSDDESVRESVLWSCPNWCSEQSTAELVATVALPSIVRALGDSKENIQSIAVKTVLLLCASGGFKTQLTKVRAKEALQKLEKTTANPTLKVAAGKALTFLP